MSRDLFDAIETNNIDALMRAIGQGADPNAAPLDQPTWSPLKAAIESLTEGGSIDAVVILIRQGALVDGSRNDKASPLIVAASCRHWRRCEFFSLLGRMQIAETMKAIHLYGSLWNATTIPWRICSFNAEPPNQLTRLAGQAE